MGALLARAVHGSPQESVANLLTEFPAHEREALTTKGENRRILDFLGGCNFRERKNLRFAERLIRNAEVRGLHS